MSDLVLVDEPAPLVRRLTLNRPDKRNAMNNELRTQLFALLRAADADRAVRVIIIRGSGSAFCSGYDLGRGRDVPAELSHHAAIEDGYWPRHVLTGWFEMWDYATPLIAQVHGWCLAGGSELATACDLVYVADDAQIGYPPVRVMSSPDMAWHPWLLGMRRGLEAVLTGDAMTGVEAAAAGFATRSVPLEQLEDTVLAAATKVAKIPHDILAINKRSFHRSMEIMGIRDAMRAAAEISALGMRSKSSTEYSKQLAAGVSAALTARDGAFGDYRTAGPPPAGA
jgi:enoyl-CoA hydratase